MKMRAIIKRMVSPEDVVFHGGTAYIDQPDGIEVFAYVMPTERRLVNGIIPVRIPRAAILAYLANFPVAK